MMQKILQVIVFVALVLWVDIETKNDAVVTEFYFVRHGQTDHNVSKNKEFYPDIPLNAVGFEQVQALKLFVETLPIKSICCSPLLRARQTVEAVSESLKLPIVIIQELSEGTHEDWCELQRVKNQLTYPVSKRLQAFIERLKKGLTKALRQKSPTLIVAHGGVYSGLCRALDLQTDSWSLSNCSVVRFYQGSQGAWRVELLFTVTGGSMYDQPDSLLYCRV